MPTRAAVRFVSHEWRVFGTGGRLVVPEGEDLAAARAAVDRELGAVDDAANRFRDDSEIGRVNRSAGTPHAVSGLFVELLTVALDAAAATDGAVDPTLGSVLRHLGYDRTFSDVGPGDALGVTLRLPADWRSVEVDPDGGPPTVLLPRGLELDLGATAKAHACDRAAAAAREATGSPVLLSLGGDVAAAGPPPPDGWAVAVLEDSGAVAAPADPVVVLRSGGLATSSTSVRRWQRGDTTVHHLIDPMTCLPAAGPWRTATVAAATCLEANVAATAAIVMGTEAPRWLARRGLPARLVGQDGSVVALAGWPRDEECR